MFRLKWKWMRGKIGWKHISREEAWGLGGLEAWGLGGMGAWRRGGRGGLEAWGVG